MATLESGFEDALREAVLDDAERVVREDLGPLLVDTAQENFQAYAARNGYDIDHIWEDVDAPTIERRRGRIQMRVEWPELTALFEFGVAPHTIEGNPLLHFFWEAKDTWVQTESVDWGSETGGISESRAIRDALATLRQEARR